MSWIQIDDPASQIPEFEKTNLSSSVYPVLREILLEDEPDFFYRWPANNVIRIPLVDAEFNSFPRFNVLRNTHFDARVVLPIKGTVAIEGNTVKSGGAVRPSTGYIYPRCY